MWCGSCRGSGGGCVFCCSVRAFVEEGIFYGQEDLGDGEFDDAFGICGRGRGDAHAAPPHFFCGKGAYGAGSVKDNFQVGEEGEEFLIDPGHAPA